MAQTALNQVGADPAPEGPKPAKANARIKAATTGKGAGRGVYPKDNEPLYLVRDLNATEGVRVHEVEGMKIKLYSDRDIPLPWRVAKAFSDPSFTVVDPKTGKRIDFSTKRALPAGMRLQPGQVIVDIQDLSDEALLRLVRTETRSGRGAAMAWGRKKLEALWLSEVGADLYGRPEQEARETAKAEKAADENDLIDEDGEDGDGDTAFAEAIGVRKVAA